MLRKTITIIFIGLSLLLGAGFFLSPEFNLEQSVIIKASPEKIHAYVSDLKQWPKWTPWQELEPGTIISLGNVTKGVGASQTWQSPRGNGRLYITVSSPFNGIAYDEFLGKNSNPYICAIEYKMLDSDSTRVTWRVHGEVEMSLVGGYIAMAVKFMIRDMYRNGLLKLKIVVEDTH